MVRDEPITLPFTVKPGIVISPPSARVGDTVTVYGSGFPASDKGYIAIDTGQSSISLTTTDKGSFNASLVIPNLTIGNHFVKASSNYLGDDYTSEVLEVISKTGTPAPTPPPVNPTPNPPVPTNNPTANIPVKSSG